ncbi:KAP family P-loop domain-containing protein [Ruminobacter amylophilus]|uniref:KAP family P-loop domain-containing protein n=1 Tax=Ruminobacter amylophilus TaxID=867 RepID=A0A662ZM01_9GAMM|nr:P-loop NTPase fold protein [Ruminobacter amylophilus]SFP79412.1 KAP family P-loop domain-containing protein [Ruminobacter amylophilus]
MFNADRAIENKKDDLLGRAPFSAQLGRDIYEYNGEDSLVIAIYGKWGTGKTSIANMVLEEIESLSESNKNETIVIKFEPWNYSDQDNLIHHFFNLLENAISSGNVATLMKNVRKILKKYSKYFELIPYENPWNKFFCTSMINLLRGNLDLYSCKNKLKDALLEANKKIVVLIDDIDRLTNSQIRNIIQIVKQIGDLPKITYILAMDREVVAHALEDDCCNNGNEYLEKIVQIPFQIPPLSQVKLHEIFHNKLGSSIRSVSKNIAIRDNYYWCTVLDNCIFPYLYTIYYKRY